MGYVILNLSSYLLGDLVRVSKCEMGWLQGGIRVRLQQWTLG